MFVVAQGKIVHRPSTSPSRCRLHHLEDLLGDEQPLPASQPAWEGPPPGRRPDSAGLTAEEPSNLLDGEEGARMGLEPVEIDRGRSGAVDDGVVLHAQGCLW